MQSILITLAIFAAIALIHFSYVDFRFRHRDGFRWYWLLSPAPPLMWVSRVAIIAALVGALAVGFIGTTETVAWVLAGLMLVHVVSLILLEVLEPR